jgi:hypothetical protein
MRMELIKKVIAIAAVMIVSCNCFACDCKGNSILSKSIKTANVIFSGTVISTSVTTNYDSLEIVAASNLEASDINWREVPSAVIKIKVQKVYRGKATSDTITVITPAEVSGCGYSFKLNKKYIVYAYSSFNFGGTAIVRSKRLKKSKLFTHLCTRTQAWNSKEENEILNFLKSSKK